jgi:hypothetical protein
MAEDSQIWKSPKTRQESPLSDTRLDYTRPDSTTRGRFGVR